MFFNKVKYFVFGAIVMVLLGFGCTDEEELVRPDSIDINGVPAFSLTQGTVAITTYNGAPDTANTASVLVGSDSDIELESLESMVTYEQPDFPGWLSVSLSSNATPSLATLTVAPEGLPPGSYTAEVVFTSNALNIDTALTVQLQIENPPLIGGWALQRVCTLGGDCRDASDNDAQLFMFFSDDDDETGRVDIGGDCDLFGWTLNANGDELRMTVNFQGEDQEFLFGLEYDSEEHPDAESAITLTDLSFNFGRQEQLVLHYLPDTSACQ